MEPFKTHRGVAVTLDTANVDTDQIIAKQFLKSIARTGFGEHLFHDWRYDATGKPNADFPLNAPSAQKASILVARNNFGCGSSREHAVWAVQQYGFRAVIAPWKISGQDKIPAFADIFRNNSGKNGLLTVELTDHQVDEIFETAEKNPGIEITVDLENQVVLLHGPKQASFPFSLDPAVKHRLLNGLDDIGISLKSDSLIEQFEAGHTTWINRNH
jgi:3-isopropylmalate/(R)-2-methylmalate dehydratase small subunit